MEPLKDIIIIYHDHCLDGFAASWSAWVKYGEKASYIPASYGDDVPDVSGKEVYIIDFSYSGDTLTEIEKKAKSLVVIDHHEGAKDRVKALKSYVFDVNHSGAYLAWQYFHPGLKVPRCIEYISEGDIFKLTLPKAQEVLAYLHVQPREFQIFNRLFEELDDEKNWQTIVEKGELLLLYREVILKTCLESVHFIDLDGLIVPSVNITLPGAERSDLLHKIYEKYPHISMGYRYAEGEWRCSLRSDLKINCIEIAKKFGGSGHPGAAGFIIKAEPGVFPFKIVSGINNN